MVVLAQNRSMIVTVNYKYAPIRCRFCLSLHRKMLNCLAKCTYLDDVQAHSNKAMAISDDPWLQSGDMTHGYHLKQSLVHKADSLEHNGAKGDNGFQIIQHCNHKSHIQYLTGNQVVNLRHNS